MSKIVCDVCGSTYSETEVQCPICGTAKSEAAKPVVEANGENQSNKGGKFSKTNNRKAAAGGAKKSGGENSKAGEEGTPSNVAMIVIVAVLLLAIVTVCVFIAVRLINRPEPDPNIPSQSTSATVPCTGIALADSTQKTLTFTELSQTVQLSVYALPENTTDIVDFTYTTSDPTVVTVSTTGLVTPVASGTATITIAYGSYTIPVSVTCDIPKLVTEIKLAKTEVTLSRTNGLTAQLYNGELNPADITWTSSDETVATVENGKVTAVAEGKVTITAIYVNSAGEQLKATCTVHVRDLEIETTFALGCTITDLTLLKLQDDVTMKVGDKLKVYLIDTETNTPIAGLTWEPSNDFKGGCASFEQIEGGIEVTALKSTAEVSGQYVYIQTTYEGTTYRFIIRIKTATTQE